MQQEIWFQKYKILSLLGSGGTAKVYLAEHVKLNSYRAIKVISKNHPLYEILRNEALLLKNLKHSCIPIIYDIEEDEEGSYIVEQYLEGNTLKEYVALKGTLREDIIISFGLQLCDLIHYLHSTPRPIVYVDLKPDNIILSGMTLKLIDFGSAIYSDELAKKQKYCATIGYAAPELYLQNTIDERCDVYGIGMLLYYMATGIILQQDCSEMNHIDLVGKCSKKLKNIINHCLKFNPSQRYASVVKLTIQLSALLQKNQFQSKTSPTIRIAIAGAQPRIGVTHFAFRLCNYYIGRKQQCLYQEKNSGGCVRSIKSRYEEVSVKEGIYEIYGIPMLPYRKGCQLKITGFAVVVQDFGCLTIENREDYLSADKKILILGAKDWELEYSENLLDMVAEYKDIFYLFNFMDGRQFQRVMKSMNHRNSDRIPYEPDPFARISPKNGLDLFKDLMEQPKSRARKGKAVQFIRRGKEPYEEKTDADQ